MGAAGDQGAEQAAPDPAASQGIEERVGDFLTAPQFKTKPPRFFPRLTLAAARLWSKTTSRLGDAIFEHGVETTGHAHEIAHFHPDRVWYQASGWSYLRRALPRSEVSAEDVFLDIGSGKGRVLLQAARRYRFRRIIGVEISEELNVIARNNLERRRGRLAGRQVEIETGDAATYEIPDDVTVAYLFYPFVGDTFRKVMARLVESLERNPRRFRLIYALPVMEDAILETGMFRPARTIRVIDQGIPHRIAVYEARPSPARSSA
jgi:SAM-dependent methyltransferase